MANVMSTRMKPAAAALLRKAASGREVQLNIWIGITVKGADNQSKRPAAGSPWNGTGGRKAIKVSAPTVIIGAVSPIARAILQGSFAGEAIVRVTAAKGEFGIDIQ